MLPGSSIEDRKEFLADVSAFANTGGGVILYGIETERDPTGKDTGIARGIIGLKGINPDKEKQRLAAMLHDGISPSLASHIALQDIDGAESNAPVIALGVSQSLARPHMITFQKSGKFWRRSDSGKYQPDIEELRSMFREADSWVSAAEDFRDQRFVGVRGNEPVVPFLNRDASLFAHLLPLGRLRQLVNLGNHEARLRTDLPPLGSYTGWSWHFNAEGFLVYYQNGAGHIQSYSQWFRFGGVEGYDSYVVAQRAASTGQQIKQFFAQDVVKDLLIWLPKALAAVSGLGIEPPYVLMLSLFGLQQARILLARGFSDPIVSDRLLLPPVLIEDESVDVKDLLSPLFDIIWQTAGLPAAPK